MNNYKSNYCNLRVKKIVHEFSTKSKDKVIQATGKSMLPLFEPNDVLIWKKNKLFSCHLHDIVIINDKSRLLTHRLIYKSKKYFVTKGDNNPITDGRLTSNRLVGKVTEIKRQGKLIKLSDLYQIQSLFYTRAIIQLCRALNVEGVNYLILKGLPVYQKYNKTFPNRLYADCDLLIENKYQIIVDNILKKLGFQPENPNKYESLSRFLTKGLKEIEYSKLEQGVPITFDIHFIIALSSHKVALPIKMLQHEEQMLTDFYLETKKTITFSGQLINILNTENLIMYLAIHQYGHNWNGINRFDLMVDVIKKSKNINWRQIFKDAEKYKVLNFIIPSFYILKKYYQINPPYQFLKNNYCKNLNYSLGIYRFFGYEKELFDYLPSLITRLKKAALIFLYYEDIALKKLYYILHPKLIAHGLYYVLKLTLFVINNAKNRVLSQKNQAANSC